MNELWLWLAGGIAILVAAYGLTTLFWRPERNVGRTQLGHWYRSLIRLYDADARIEIVQRGGSLVLTLLRRGGDERRGWVVLSCPRSAFTEEQLETLRPLLATEPSVLLLSEAREASPSLDVQIAISDIWSPFCADKVVWVTEHLFGMLRVPTDARFDLEFTGERSMDRMREARRRQKDGSLEKW